MDPKYIKPEVTAQCAQVDHRCSGFFCGCECHAADRAIVRAQLDAEAASLRPAAPVEIKLPDLSRVALEPGDVLLVRTEQRITRHDAAMIRERLRLHFPDNDAVVFGPGVELAVIRPAEGERLELAPTPDEIARRFAEANDRPEHIGRA